MLESMGFGGSTLEFLHHTRMVDLRARLGITEEKSGVDESGKVGVKPRALQALTQARSKVWPDETMTGSAIRDLEIGQRNSIGGCFGLGFNGFEGREKRDLLKIFHLNLGVRFHAIIRLPVSSSNARFASMDLGTTNFIIAS